MTMTTITMIVMLHYRHNFLYHATHYGVLSRNLEVLLHPLLHRGIATIVRQNPTVRQLERRTIEAGSVLNEQERLRATHHPGSYNAPMTRVAVGFSRMRFLVLPTFVVTSTRKWPTSMYRQHTLRLRRFRLLRLAVSSLSTSSR